MAEKGYCSLTLPRHGAETASEEDRHLWIAQVDASVMEALPQKVDELLLQDHQEQPIDYLVVQLVILHPSLRLPRGTECRLQVLI